MVEEAVDHHPLEGLEGRQNLAVVEASSRSDEVVSGRAHHRGLDGVGVGSQVLSVVHVGPDPKRALVVRSFVGSGDHLDAKLVVVRLSLLAQLTVSPRDSFVVNVSTTVALLV